MIRKILVTTALPYANGSIHLGHILEGIQADIFVRFQRASGNECYFFCADDTHGTPVMLAARKEGVSPEALIQRVHEEHLRDLTGFGISYDNYYSTNSPENQEFSEKIYLALKQGGHITDREIEQSYCEQDKMFLPDRFIKGTCPKCGALDQYGDSCEVCGSAYSPKDLKDSKCVICGNSPVLRKSKHLFFRLKDFEAALQDWMKDPAHLYEGGRKKLEEWFEAGLQEWDISRDGPYFGFPIPGEENKYFYVWLDAPIGYIASSKNYFQKDLELFEELWKGENTERIHFIGKDILYFHALFWPAMLMGSGFQPPTNVHVHGFITVNGEKMSKSRGTFINAGTYVKHLDPEHLRFYLAAKLGPGMDDLDLSFPDFVARVNSDLVGNIVNSVARVSTTILDQLDRKLGLVQGEHEDILKEVRASAATIAEQYENKNYSRVIREVTKLGDRINKAVNDSAPWKLVKTDPEKVRHLVTVVLNSARCLAIYLYPIIPEIAEKIYRMLQLEGIPSFLQVEETLENVTIGKYENLTTRVDEKSIQNMLEENKASAPKEEAPKEERKNSEIDISDLTKVELRIGKIESAALVEGADKLLQLTIDLGPIGKKNVFAGIRKSYKPEELEGLFVAVVANLKPRKMKFGVSEAMVLAAGEGESLTVITPHRNAKPGDLLK